MAVPLTLVTDPNDPAARRTLTVAPGTTILKAAHETDPVAKPLPHWRFHDLRRSRSSWIEEEFGREVMHACLGHSLGDRLAETYARGSGYRRKKRALQAWSDFVTSAAAKVDRSNVVPMAARR